MDLSDEEGLENHIGEARIGEARHIDALTCSRDKTQELPTKHPR